MGQRLLAAFAEIRSDLDRDPVFLGSHRASGHYTTAALEPLLTRGSDSDLAELFSDTLQGMTQYARYGGIKVVHHVYRDSHERQGLLSLTIAKGETKVVVGGLTIAGDVDNEGILVVTGDLEIAGRYIGPTFRYSLAAVGGRMTATHVTTSGEIVVGEALEASGVVHFVYNDYSAVVPRLTARALVTEDNSPVLGEVKVEACVTRNVTDEQLQTWFGGVPAVNDEPDEDEPERGVRAMILAGWEPQPKAEPKQKPKPTAKATAKAKAKPKAKPKRKR